MITEKIFSINFIYIRSYAHEKGESQMRFINSIKYFKYLNISNNIVENIIFPRENKCDKRLKYTSVSIIIHDEFVFRSLTLILSHSLSPSPGNNFFIIL